MTKMETEVFLSDIHFPFEDKLAVKLALKVIKQVQPDIVWLGGDLLDSLAISRFSKEPKRKLEFQSELDSCIRGLAQIRIAAQNAKMFYMEGNHEYRMRAYLDSKAEELRYLRALTLPALLGLDKLGIEWIPNGERVKIGKLWHIHGDEVNVKALTNIGRSIYLKLQTNVICGHFHRLQSYLDRDFDTGAPKGVYLNGCLCDLNVEYDFHPNWQQGFTIIRYTKSGFFLVEQIPVLKENNSAFCLLEGKLLTVN